MRVLRRWPALTATGLGLLGAPCVCLMGQGPAPPRLPAFLPSGRAASCSPSLRALREAAFWRTQAVQSADDACDEEREQLLRWDPLAPLAFKERRQQLLIADSTGSLRRACRAAARAAALARSPRERHQAALEMARLEPERGQR